MEIFSSYTFLIAASSIIILSFFFGEVSKKTSIPAVLMLIALGVILQEFQEFDKEMIRPILEILGIVGLIMIVLEAALELELKREKFMPIMKALVIALLGLLVSAWVAALLLHQFIPGMSMQVAWLYATPLSILSSAIIIPSVSGFSQAKKEFHIYESTFSDILGIMMFFYLKGKLGESTSAEGVLNYSGSILLTILISFLASYLIILIFQNIRSHTKLFLLISVLILVYSLAKKMHLSSLLIIFVFGIIISNVNIFFRGKLGELLHLEKAKQIYDGLHIVTMETAFVVRTFFFVFFGLSITLSSIFSSEVAVVSLLIIASIYILRFAILRLFLGEDIFPQLYIAPRGLITILLFYDIPKEAEVAGFNPGILLFIIIGTSLIMTFAMISDKQKTEKANRRADLNPVDSIKWKAPEIAQSTDSNKDAH